MAVTLTPNDVEALTGVTVTQAMIDTADQLCYDETYYTFATHNTSRLIPEAMCEQAWALATVVVHGWFTAPGSDPSITSEAQGDYSYSVDQARRSQHEMGTPITPTVRRLLDIATASWAHI